MKLLIVEDDKSVLKLVSQVIASDEIHVLTAETKQKWLEIFETQKPEILLLDGVLPDGHGFDIAREVRAIEHARNEFRTFIIFLTSLSKDEDLLEWLKSWGDVYLIKDGLAHKTAIIEAQIAVAKKNIELQQSLRIACTTDSLTGLYNRKTFDEQFDMMWEKAREQSGNMGLIFIDVDNFKKYNDVYGHAQWDLCLQKISAIFHATQVKTNSKIKVGRYGGEEFILYAAGASKQDIVNIAQYIQKEVEKLALEHKGNIPHRRVTLSMGVHQVQVWEKASKVDFFRKADTALYQAKESGRNKYILVK